MLKKSERLDRPTFTRTFAKGKRTHSPYLTIIKAPATSFSASVVVGKKVSKKAPVRNSIRRRIYAILVELKQMKKSQGIFIIITKPEITKLSKKEFSTTVRTEIGRTLN